MSDRARLPFVSVVMPVRNEGAHVGEALAALLGGDYPAARMEVLVVDGRSTDDTREVVLAAAEKDRRVVLLDNPAGTTPAGLNVGLEAAQGDVIVRLDGHSVPAQDYVAACVAALGRTGADAVGGHMIGRGATVFGRAVAAATATWLGAGDASYRLGGEGPTDTVYLGAWPREVFERVGPFDEELTRNQDYELSIRIRRSGGLVWLDPGIRSHTHVRSSPVGLARQYFGYGAGRAATFVRHPHSLRVRQSVPAAFVAGLACLLVLSAAVPRVTLLFDVAVGVYAALVVVVSAAAAAHAGGRHGRQLFVALMLAFVIMHLSWGVGYWFGLVRSLRRRLGAWVQRVAGSDMPESP